jgi:hypothetical protein
MNKRIAKLQNIMEANQRLNKSLLKEQNTHQPANFTTGQVVNAKRDVDGQMYTIKITQTTPSYMVGTITGPGNYDKQSLKNGISGLELYSVSPGTIQGNSTMGMFTVVK